MSIKQKRTPSNFNNKNAQKYFVNENYFNTWSIPMAYILGFTTADGCLSKTTNSNNFKIVYGVNIQDKCILEFIRDQISPNRIIYTNKSFYKKRNKYYFTNILTLYSTKLALSLKQYSIIERKTGNELLPYIPDKYKWSYLLGLFDGDGYVCSSKNSNGCYNNVFAICSASYTFLTQLNSDILDNLGYINKYSNKCYKLIISKRKHFKDIYHKLYNSYSFCLLRKKEKFQNIIQNFH